MSTSCYPVNAWRVIWHPSSELESWLFYELQERDDYEEVDLESRVFAATEGRGTFDFYAEAMAVVEFKTEAKARECFERLTQMEEQLVALMRAWKERNGNQD